MLILSFEFSNGLVKMPEIVWKSDAKEKKLRLGRDLYIYIYIYTAAAG